MKLLVAGSRGIPNEKITRQQLWHAFDNASYAFDIPFYSIIEGEAPGVDTEARLWAESKGYEVEPYPADWSKGRGAGYVRNAVMIKECDRAIVVWDGVSKGTAHTLSLLAESRKPYILIVP